MYTYIYCVLSPLCCVAFVGTVCMLSSTDQHRPTQRARERVVYVKGGKYFRKKNSKEKEKT